MLSKRALPATRQETEVKGCKTRSTTRNEKQTKNKKHMHAHMYTLQQQLLENEYEHGSNNFNTRVQKCGHGVMSPLKHTASLLLIKGTYLDCSGSSSSWHCCTVTRLHRELNTAWHNLPVCTSR